MDELENLLGALGVSGDFDLLGHSWGGMYAPICGTGGVYSFFFILHEISRNPGGDIRRHTRAARAEAPYNSERPGLRRLIAPRHRATAQRIPR